MAFAWTNTDADCTVISTARPAAAPCIEVADDTDPNAVYLGADGALHDVPPRPAGAALFSPAAGAWVDPRSDAECWSELRRLRGSRLRACDWTQTGDAPLTDEQKGAWQAYRQALRDLPAATLDPREPNWPLPPAE